MIFYYIQKLGFVNHYSVIFHNPQGFIYDIIHILVFNLEPQAPGQPTNITEVSMKVVSGQVSTTISWQPPRKTDLPITRYKIFWSKRLRRVTAQLEYLQEHRKIVKGVSRSNCPFVHICTCIQDVCFKFQGKLKKS